MRRGLLVLTVLAGSLAIPGGATAATLHPGDILVAGEDSNVGNLVQVDPRTGAQTVVASGSGLQDPWGVAVGPDGRIFVADFRSRVVWVVNAATGGLTPLYSDPGTSPLGLALAPDGRSSSRTMAGARSSRWTRTAAPALPSRRGEGSRAPPISRSRRAASSMSLTRTCRHVPGGSGHRGRGEDRIRRDLASPYGVALTAAGQPILEDTTPSRPTTRERSSRSTPRPARRR